MNIKNTKTSIKKISPSHPLLIDILKLSIGFPTPDKIERLLQAYSNDNENLYGAFLNQTLVGIVGFHINQHQATIRHLAVLEMYRKQGVGKQLVQNIVKEFSVGLLYAETDDDGLSFYQRCHFHSHELNSPYDSKRYACYFYNQGEFTMPIDDVLAKNLIQEQFPDWQSLPIQPVKNSGWDNRTFHLGSNMVIRIPCDAEHAPPIIKEYEWLPKLARQISIPITTPIALGQPSAECPWHWSINRWIEGETASLHNIRDLNHFAKHLGEFLTEFQSLDSTHGPIAGPHNFYRGGPLKAYDHEMQIALPKIDDVQEQKIAKALWQDALSSVWEHQPVWVHGDLAVGNLLVDNGQLKAVIDFGQLAIGDPACDLAIAWNFFTGESRETFKKSIALDQNTWIRALGWTFLKALCWPVKGMDVQRIIHDVYQDYQILETRGPSDKVA